MHIRGYKAAGRYINRPGCAQVERLAGTGNERQLPLRRFVGITTSSDSYDPGGELPVQRCTYPPIRVRTTGVARAKPRVGRISLVSLRERQKKRIGYTATALGEPPRHNRLSKTIPWRRREYRYRRATIAGRETTDNPAFARTTLAALSPLRPILPHALGNRFAGRRAHLLPAALFGRTAVGGSHRDAAGFTSPALRLCFHNGNCPI